MSISSTSIPICKTFSIRNSPTHLTCFTQRQSFSSPPASISETPNQDSFTVNYLVKTCGVPLDKAITVSKKINFETPEKPDSVIAFFCSQGLTKTQALNVIRNAPKLILSNPEKTLLPKLEFLRSKGFSSTDIVQILLKTPKLLLKSLEKQIIPSFVFVKNLIGSEEKTLSFIRSYAGPLLVNLESRLAPNVEILREAGVPDEKIALLLRLRPSIFTPNSKIFRQMVEEVKGMGFNPMKVNFVIAAVVLNFTTKAAWEKKIQAYKKWDLSKDEILAAFGKYPWFMMISEEKIMRVMDFLVNKMGLDSSCVTKRPQLLSMSLEKRVVPRCLVYQALQAKGLIQKQKISFNEMMGYPEKRFIEKVVKLARGEAPELLKLYEETLALAN